MGDNMRKVRTGDALDIPAETFNTFIDSARDFLQRQSDLRRSGARNSRNSGIILVKNVSGSDRERFHILGLKDTIILPADNEDEFKNKIALTGETPSTSTHAGKFAILLEPLKNNSIGLAMVSGVSQVRLSVTSETDTCADLSDGNAALLKTASTGPAQILWKETGTGTKWGVVRFPFATGGGSAIQLVQVKSVSSSTGTVKVAAVTLQPDATPNYTSTSEQSSWKEVYYLRS